MPFLAVFIRSIYTKSTINPPSLHILYHVRHPDKHKDTDIWRLVNITGNLACYLYRYAIILNRVINMDWHYCRDLLLTICSLIVIASPCLSPRTSAVCVGWCALFLLQQDLRTISQLDATMKRKFQQHLQRAINFFFFSFLELSKQRVGRRGGKKLTVIDVLHLCEHKLAGILFNCELLMCCLKKPAVAGANGRRKKRLPSPRADEVARNVKTLP